MNNSNDDYNIYISSSVTSSTDPNMITISGSSGNQDSSVYTITLNDTIDLSGITVNTLDSIDIGKIDGWVFNETTPFEDGFPEWNDFQEMCREYPGLEKTLEHLKAFYKLCKDDWEAKKRGEND